jgi:succinate dehydrogenase hydrophobic anchor subunit
MLSNFAFLGLSGVAAFIVIILLLLIFAFEVAMFISVILNKNITGNTKALWILGMLLIHPFVAIWYYFTDYKKAI